MFSEDSFLGCPQSSLKKLKSLSDTLNAQVVEQVNETQELVMLNDFAHEANEMQLRKSLQERISDIASWRWVLDDLSKRLVVAIDAVQYEQSALRVVVERVKLEVENFSRESSRPGALNPFSDIVEEAVIQEHNFLREQKKQFEKLILRVDKQLTYLRKLKKIIDDDLLKKQDAINVEESCASIVNIHSPSSSASKRRIDAKTGKQKKACQILQWGNHCLFLKATGLKALSDALNTKQMVRGERVKLSISAQAYASRVDAALRRRSHANKVKLDELIWQKKEAIRDLKSLDEELASTEQSLIGNMEQEQVIKARISDRALRPPGEMTKDDVDMKLRDELSRIKSFVKQLRSNVDRITSLQNNLNESITSIENCAEDILHVACLDEERIRSRLGENVKCETGTSSMTSSVTSTRSRGSRKSNRRNLRSTNRSRTEGKIGSLTAIKEEGEDDYPFDD